MSTLHISRPPVRAALVAALVIGAFLAPPVEAARTVYAVAAGANSVFTAPVAVDGTLSSFSSLSLTDPHAVVLSADGTHAYVAEGSAAAVAVYGVSASGALQYQSSSSTGANPSALSLTPDGTLLFSADESGGVSVFAVASDGSLSSPSGSGLSLPTSTPAGIAVSPDGLHLFVVESAAAKVATFSIGAEGALTPEHDASTGTGPSGITLSPDGLHAYVANSGGSISAFTVSATGELTALSGSPYPADAGSRGIAMSPDGTRLVVAADTSGTVRSWTVGATGVPTPVAGSASLSGASGVTTSPDGTRAYVSSAGVIRAFGFTTASALAQVGTDAATFSQTDGVAVSPDRAPTAVMEVVPAYAGAETAFEGGHSTDSDGLPALWTWNFGDGKTAVGQHPLHAYATAGTYTVKLTVADNEGCSTTVKWASQMAACSGGAGATVTRSVTIADQPPPVQEVPPCIHDGNDGFCGTPDQKAPKATIAGVNDGASMAEIDAPDEIGGFITPDPSGIRSVTLKLTKAAGFKMATKLVPLKRCRKPKGSKKKRCSYVKRCHKVRGKQKCTGVKTKKKVKTRTAVCDTIAPGKNFFVRKNCADVTPISIGGDVTFRYSFPAALGLGTYTLEVLVTDNAGNSDVLEQGRNEVTFKIVNTPSNQGGGGTVTPPTSTTPSEPITDTGSPFG